MTLQQKGVLLLVKSALTGIKYELPEEFNLTEAFKIARVHGIECMFYYGALNCGVDANSEEMRAALSYVYKNIAVCERQSIEIKRVTDAFDNGGIMYMPLKGTIMRRLYPKPEMRRMGDADILIKTEQYDKIREIMLNLSYEEGYVSDHELAWNSKSLHLELHKRLIPSYNKDYYAYFGDGWKLAKIVSDNGCAFSMTAEDEMIYLFIHFAKHYRDAGIGLRHLVDLWVFRTNNPELDEKYIQAELEKLEVFEFYKNILNTLTVWFEDAECDEKSDFITQFIFTCGEFGKSELKNLSATLKDMKSESSVSGIKLKRVFSTVFVKRELMNDIYPVLKKHPWLLPIYWVRHFFRRAMKKKSIVGAVQKRLDVNTTATNEYRDSLNYVGLDFNFKD